MNVKLKDLINKERINKNTLLKILQEDAKQVDVRDIISSSIYLHHDGRYLPEDYRKEYLKAYVKGFLTRIKDVKEDSNNYTGVLDIAEFEKAIFLLEDQEIQVHNVENSEPAFFRIYEIIALYTTFILDEPVHQEGTLFPGGFRVKLEKGIFFCPVKKNNENNPLAVCPFCIAQQDPES
jgi:uncharacterized protein (UPF0305 family)